MMRLSELDPEFARTRAGAWKKGLTAALSLTGLMWVSWLLTAVTPFGQWLHGIYPRQMAGISGILFAPLVHNGLAHLFSNTLPILLAVLALFGNYPRSAWRVLVAAWISTGLLVWLFARPAWHAGASGLLYALLAFIFISGFIRRDKQSVGISMVVVFLYGGLLFGIIPDRPNISWESHLAGLVVGMILAWWFRAQDVPVFRRYDLDDDPDDMSDHALLSTADPVVMPDSEANAAPVANHPEDLPPKNIQQR